MNNLTELEVSGYPIDKEAARIKLRNLKADLVLPEKLMIRSIFTYPDNIKIHEMEVQELNNQKFLNWNGALLPIKDPNNHSQVFCTYLDLRKGNYIRVRGESNKITMSIKIHANHGEAVELQQEVYLEVEDYEKAVGFLKLGGLQLRSEQENLREVWNLNTAEICLDTWPGLDSYLEIEAKTLEDLQNIKSQFENPNTLWTVASVCHWYNIKYGVSETTVNNEKELKFNNLPLWMKTK